jgi:hypothetical protein
MLMQPHPNFRGRNQSVYVILKQLVKELMWSYGDAVPHQIVVGTIGRNEMDTHANTCCARANW